MKPTLTTFFQTYPLTGDMELALKIVKKELEHAIKDLEEKEGNEYLTHLSEAFRMMEAIFNEMGLHPSNY